MEKNLILTVWTYFNNLIRIALSSFCVLEKGVFLNNSSMKCDQVNRSVFVKCEKPTPITTKIITQKIFTELFLRLLFPFCNTKS